MKHPVILILTKEVGLYYTFRDNIRETFGKDIQLRSNHFPPVDLEGVDLILSSGTDNLHQDIVETSKVTAPLFIANRSIDFNKLEMLFELPEGTECLLVSNAEDVAYESVAMLERLGFNYLHFTAYSPDMAELPDLSGIDVAITHGLVDLVPEGMGRVLDLGNRRLDLSTLFEIAKALGQTLHQANRMTMDYVRNFVRIGRELATASQNEHDINSYLEAVLDAAQEGIIFVSPEGNISLFNQEASKILGIDGQAALNKRWTEVLRGFPIEQVMKTKEPMPRQTLQIQGLHLVTTMNPLEMNGVFTGIIVTFQDVTHVQRMEQEIRKKKTESGLTTKYTFADNAGDSQLMMQTRDIAKKLARSEYTVLITGESGTGKEIFAQAIHEHSSRSNGPFVAVNFAGITESLAESELFGYAEGAFTGAMRGGNPGLFELAQSGTIFLDEIGDAPLKIQAAILRVLQEKQVMRVGGNKVVPTNVRVIAATNKHPEHMIKEGTFREDLFYRLNQLPLEIPPLRERTEDIPALIEYFLEQKNIQMHFSPEVMEKLFAYRWPGNVRELEALVTYLSVIVDGTEPTLDDLPGHIKEGNVDEPKIDRIVNLLKNTGDGHVFKEILQCLSLNQNQHVGIGRNTLKSMMTIPISESQLRSRLDMLKRYTCVQIGSKKQGTKITQLGMHVLERL
ncbi:sigma-54 interaction domain-containing protein [Lentibacillus cibarius]|uniref:PAS domain-containing protein n=1 Tax=Lentibacillus cibarius TaxID=2583219 RepID=A0A5S3QIB4_9BACI|nr:sigma 54-interacting transcriptional regulator [Lentibacillus cibarius]TMN21644.1 PAS domain-containing protein [Lentibacillus cibarius]